jgi:carboxyl-terminal processing protease
MKTTTMTVRNLCILLTFAVGSFFVSCRKTDATNTNPSTPPVGTGGTLSGTALRDSTIEYAREVYLWYNQIPTDFAQQETDPSLIMEDLHKYSVEPGFSNPVDRWSFGMKKADWDNLTAGMSSTNNTSSDGDFGISVFFRAEGDLRVRLVEPNSPAGAAQIHRGWRITRINGSTSITTSNADYIVNNVYYSNSSSFTFVKPDGTVVDMTLNAAHYNEQPVYMDHVYNVNGKNVGYLVFNSFLGDTNRIYSDFQRVFSNFANAGVSELVVDLRYNGGGYVSVQEKLADYLVPSSANGALMFNEKFNDKNSDYNSAYYFHKLGSLNLTKIFFIVTKSTASASELLINNLKPYMNVKLVGPNTTHGKPVGFFPIPVGDWYIFPVSFRSTNKNGEGNYFNGMAVNYAIADGLDHDWGEGESCLSGILSGLGNGTMSMTSGAIIENESPAVSQGNKHLDAPAFKGMLK